MPSDTIQEAMVCDTVVSLLKSDVTSHLIIDGWLMVANFDPVDFSKRSDPVLFDNAELERSKMETRALINNYSWRIIAEKCLGVYQKPDAALSLKPHSRKL